MRTESHGRAGGAARAGIQRAPAGAGALGGGMPSVAVDELALLGAGDVHTGRVSLVERRYVRVEADDDGGGGAGGGGDGSGAGGTEHTLFLQYGGLLNAAPEELRRGDLVAFTKREERRKRSYGKVWRPLIQAMVVLRAVPPAATSPPAPPRTAAYPLAPWARNQQVPVGAPPATHASPPPDAPTGSPPIAASAMGWGPSTAPSVVAHATSPSAVAHALASLEQTLDGQALVAWLRCFDLTSYAPTCVSHGYTTCACFVGLTAADAAVPQLSPFQPRSRVRPAVLPPPLPAGARRGRRTAREPLLAARCGGAPPTRGLQCLERGRVTHVLLRWFTGGGGCYLPPSPPPPSAQPLLVRRGVNYLLSVSLPPPQSGTVRTSPASEIYATAPVWGGGRHCRARFNRATTCTTSRPAGRAPRSGGGTCRQRWKRRRGTSARSRGRGRACATARARSTRC